MTFEFFNVDFHVFAEIDSDGVREDTIATAQVSASYSTMSYVPYLIVAFYDAFSEQETRCELVVIAGRSHRDRDRTMRAVCETKSYLEGFLDRKNIGRVFRYRTVDTSNGGG